MPELTQLATDLPRSAAPVGPAEYQRVIARVREEVARVLPPGSILLVVSRGDEELIRFPNHKGWHFPRTAGGEYGGHHPQDSEDAISRLEELGSLGAGYIVFPRTAFWWFEHYRELAKYLTSRAQLLIDDREVCLIFALQPATKGLTRTGVVQSAVPSHMADLVETLLPEGCDVAVAQEESEAPPGFGERRVWRLPLADSQPRDSNNSRNDAIQALDELKRAGVFYLVVPRAVEHLVRRNSAVRRYLEASARLITRQRNVGTIYDLDASKVPNRYSSANGNDRGEGMHDR